MLLAGIQGTGAGPPIKTIEGDHFPRRVQMNTSLAHHTPNASTAANLEKCRRVRAKDHLFLIIR
jgi:hypothetical protein